MSAQTTAAADPVRAIVTTGSKPDPGSSTLTDALDSAGLTLSADDQKVVDWLGGADPQTAATIADWVQRAASGKA